MELNIDLNGGDIIQLALPQYLKQLNVTDDPFMVLESSQDRSYVAQSGLIGANGIDSAGRAVYRTATTNYRLADNENTIRRSKRDREDTAKYAAASFARDVLTVADNLKRALDVVPKSIQALEEAKPFWKEWRLLIKNC